MAREISDYRLEIRQSKDAETLAYIGGTLKEMEITYNKSEAIPLKKPAGFLNRARSLIAGDETLKGNEVHIQKVE